MTESFAAPYENAPRADASNDEDELCSDRFKRGTGQGGNSFQKQADVCSSSEEFSSGLFVCAGCFGRGV